MPFGRRGTGHEKRPPHQFVRIGQIDVVSRSPSLKPKAFDHVRDPFTRIEREVFDAHLSVDKFNLGWLNTDRLLFFCFDEGSPALPMSDQVLEQD